MSKTLKNTVELSGVGLHSGVTTTVRLLPDDRNWGRYFVRVDLPDKPVIRATVDSVSQTTLSTELGNAEAKVRTVEHLLAALAANNIANARIEVDNAELPLLDGSAKIWTEAIAKAEFSTTASTEAIAPSEPIWIREGDAFVAALPAIETRFTYGIDFADYPAIANQWHSWSPGENNFNTEIAPARTFGFAEQIAQLQQAGLIAGGSLDNALVCSQDGWVNPPLRFTNEPARHKLLDLVGDISLLGQFPQAHIIAYKASHKLHVRLAKELALLPNGDRC
ncbi:UDP-3-O-acyl-N-acetylglucosamine deacetylase [Myxosarcina sp. GI1]|uniref:UDP-3-O-acyl-N-acetylglucosamine deacetylase n=1 Tax=Myxosarcina sp. GI1 TaxID=1541065 RepID=UPI00055A4284|nr:UDP-3-O-acyl-N-acetylglucosamine deacetylase [Myxosarcina sp. GI1]